MSELIRPHTCRSCSASHAVGAELECRAEPPTVMPLVGQGPNGPVIGGRATVFPAGQPAWWCLRWKPKIEVAR